MLVFSAVTVPRGMPWKNAMVAEGDLQWCCTECSLGSNCGYHYSKHINLLTLALQKTPKKGNDKVKYNFNYPLSLLTHKPFI